MTTSVSQQFETLAKKAADTLRHRTADNQIRIQVGSATCEHAAGSNDVLDEFRKHIAASGRTDIVLHQTGCTGRCSREPIVGVIVPGQMPVKYERVDRETGPRDLHPARPEGKPVLERMLDGPIEQVARVRILICGSVRCGWKGARPFDEVLAEKLPAAGLTPEQVRVTRGELLRGVQHGRGRQVLAPAGPARQGALSHRQTRPTWTRSSASTSSAAGRSTRLEVPGKTVGRKFFELYGDVAFFNRQSRVALRHNGVIDPESIEEYFHYRGFQALAKVLEKNDPQWVIDEVTPLEAPRPRRRRLSHRPEVGDGAPRPPRPPATSSATPTRATPARSWTAACWRAIRSTWSKA